MTLIRGGTLVQNIKYTQKKTLSACTLLPLFILVPSSHSYADFLREKKEGRGSHKSHQQKIKQKERKKISAEKQILNLI